MLSQKRFSFHNGQYVGCSTLYLIMNIGVRSNPKAVRRMLVWSGTTDSLSALYSSLILTEGSQDAAIINSTQEAFKSHVSGISLHTSTLLNTISCINMLSIDSPQTYTTRLLCDASNSLQLTRCELHIPLQPWRCVLDILQMLCIRLRPLPPAFGPFRG
jgi:hypothetical protein